MSSTRLHMGRTIFILQLLSSLRIFDNSANAGGVNLALHKPTSQSSEPNQFSSSLVVDGKTGDSRLCSQTAVEGEPWWTVDLQNIYKIQNVRIYFNHDVNDIWSLSVHVHTDSVGTMTICEQDVNYETDILLSVNCQGEFGRFITVQLEKNPGALALCEVEVFGEEPSRNDVFSRHFCRSSEKAGLVIVSLSARSRIECAVLCAGAHNCDAFDFLTDHGEKSPCQLKELTSAGSMHQDKENYYGC